VAATAGLAACAGSEHTVEPYRSDADRAAALERRADEACRLQRAAVGLEGRPERPFRTDGCSAWPDSETTLACCVEHDIAYWCGGTARQRLAADDAFGACVRARADSSLLGALMRGGVRMGGHPVFPMPYRWGFGDAYRGGYPDPPEVAPAFDGAPPARAVLSRSEVPSGCP
jgi:hypothetical protein